MYPGHRQVLIFYNQAGVAIKDKQINDLHEDKKGLEERDIIIHTFEVNKAESEVKKYSIDTADLFTFILIGKDGGEKFRSKAMVTNKKLFSIIDVMPMRREEMKKQDG